VLAEDALVPRGLQHPRFVAVPLTADVAALDYAAYLASPDVVRVHSDGRWPVDGFTLAEDLEQVERHWRDHQAHRAFAFTFLTPSRSEGLGCLYLNPLRDYLGRAGAGAELLDLLPAASAMVTFWLRQDQQHTGLAEDVVSSVDGWLRRDWPLDTYLFRVLPGERSSCAALEAHGLPQVDLALPAEPRPYRWFGPATGASGLRRRGGGIV
jgi:RimJ/RimL family protein N-acetyltransferase